jgi:hypothetical protein
MKESKDLRFKVLEYLQENGSSTEEVQCNEFLSKLHGDLATIRRTIKELIEKGYINESNIDWDKDRDKSIIFNLNTTGATGQENNRVERLLNPKEIGTIRLYLTLDGKKFLVESENLRRTTWMIRNDNKIKVLFAIFGAALGVASTLVTHYVLSDKDASTNTTKVNVTVSQQTDTTTIYHNSTANLKSRFIPNHVFEMRNLRTLSIQGMDCDYGDTTSCWMIREIPKQIGKLKELEVLQLNVNALRTIPKEINELKRLKTLDLTDNPGLSDIDNVVALLNLEKLYLFGCSLDKLPMDIGELKNLKQLGLTGNNIDKVELDRIRKALPNCKVTYDN